MLPHPLVGRNLSPPPKALHEENPVRRPSLFLITIISRRVPELRFGSLISLHNPITSLSPPLRHCPGRIGNVLVRLRKVERSRRTFRAPMIASLDPVAHPPDVLPHEPCSTVSRLPSPVLTTPNLIPLPSRTRSCTSSNLRPSRTR